MIDRKIIYNKNILIAVDESENARRAVSYVSQLLTGVKGFKGLNPACHQPTGRGLLSHIC